MAVFTDGGSNSFSATKSAADSLKKKAVIISVGIGTGINEAELNEISTDGTYSGLDDYDEIEALVGEILQETCSDQGFSIGYKIMAIFISEPRRNRSDRVI